MQSAASAAVGLLRFLAGEQHLKYTATGLALGSASCAPASLWQKASGRDLRERQETSESKAQILACSWEAHHWHALPSPCGARRKPRFFSCLQFLEAHKLYSHANLFSVGSLNLRPLVGYPFLLILSSLLVDEGYLCSGLEGIREHKPGSMVKQGMVLIKGGGCVCSANIIHFGSSSARGHHSCSEELPCEPLSPSLPFPQAEMGSVFHPFKILFTSAFFCSCTVLSQWYLSKGQALCLWQVPIQLFQLVY